MPDRLIPILKQTAQSQKKQPPTEGGAPGGLVDVYAWLNRAGALLAPWWSRARDKQLRYFWKQNDALASAMYTLNSKILSIPFHVEPRDISIRAHLKQAGEFEHNLWEMTGFGAGWIQGIAPILEDLFGQDNGMFIELIGEGPKDGPIVGPVLGVAHLDAAQCLGRDSRVLLADGTTVPIYRMVRDKHPGPIMSLGESGQLESKPVTGWHEVGLGERHWLRIGVEYSRHVFGRSEGLWVTDDHEILTPAGWTPAGRLSVGDMIATSFREPSGIHFAEIIEISEGDNGGQIQSFCLDVKDNHNFVADGMIVHNCIRTRSPEYPVIYYDLNGDRYKFHHTRIAYASQMPSSRADMNGVGFCLDGDASILMATGSYKRIRDVVRDKDVGPVISVDSCGKLVSRSITNWHTNPRYDRKMINVRGEHVRYIQGKQQRNSWVTEDHPILTPSGYVPAGQIRTGDLIVTSSPSPNENQIAFLIGTLLGDSTLSGKRNPRLSFGHSDKQKEWFDLKSSVIEGEFGFTRRKESTSIGGKIFGGYKGETRTQGGFAALHDAFYPQDKKVLPLDLLDLFFKPITLATWYLDDGHILNTEDRKRPRAAITAEGFDALEVEIACRWLTHEGFECYPTKGGENKRNIGFTANGSEELFKVIAKYVPPSMRYKIPEGLDDFDPDSWNLGRSERFVDTAIVKTWDRTIRGKVASMPTTVYCIDVDDTHNFISAGIVVHNCACSRAINAAQNIYDIQVYKMEKLGSRPKRQILVGEKGLTANDIMMAMRTADEAMDNEGLTRASRTVVIAPKHVLPQTEVRLNQIDLASVPDGFDEQQSITTGVYILAWAFGVDAREFWPASATGATKADALLQHMKARGKAVGNTLTLFEKIINTYVLPAHLKFSFDVQDDDEDQQRADISATVSQTTERDVNAGLYDVRKARVEMVNAGHMTQQEFEDLELKDGRLEGGEDILSLFYSDDPLVAPLLKLGVKDPLDTEALYWEELQPAVNAQKRECLKVIAMQLNATTVAIRHAATKAKAALDALEKYWQQNGASYQEEQMAEEGEQPVEGEQPPAPEGEAPPATEETPPEEGKDMGDTVIRLKQPNVKVYVPRQRPPIVNVTVPQAPLDVEKLKDLVQAPPARIIVNVPPQAPPVVNVQVPVQPVDVHVDAKIEPTVEDIAVQRDHDGKITGMMKRVRANK